MARDEEDIIGLLLGRVVIYGISKYDNRKTQERKNAPAKSPKGLDEEVFKVLCVESSNWL